jgi:hypothetical protein
MCLPACSGSFGRIPIHWVDICCLWMNCHWCTVTSSIFLNCPSSLFHPSSDAKRDPSHTSHVPSLLLPTPPPVPMLRISRSPRIHIRPPIQIVRRITTTPHLYAQNNPHSKIHAMPFKLSEDKARSLIDLTAYVNEHTFASFFKILGSVSTRLFQQTIDVV